MKKDWRFAIQGGLLAASNFEKSRLISDDLITTGTVLFVKDKKDNGLKKPWRLILGLTYSTTSGRPIPIPIVSYFKQIDDKLSYNLGVPKTNIKYSIKNKHQKHLLLYLLL